MVPSAWLLLAADVTTGMLLGHGPFDKLAFLLEQRKLVTPSTKKEEEIHGHLKLHERQSAFQVPIGSCPRHGLVSPSGVRLAVDHNHRPCPRPRRSTQRRCVPDLRFNSEVRVRSTFLRACMRDDRRTIHRQISSETEARDGSALRDVARQSGALRAACLSPASSC
ncbi:hypothetical protein BDA96_01G317800 [Sorghum bicolor]|uniref:Secreted protein n=1 Tax=Sorghum bicolor TaxID=4558 RepID=A0A921S222_SORBI|nr:hypothetical protein BDA96_01G317800 [Sorghum bicolor]